VIIVGISIALAFTAFAGGRSYQSSIDKETLFPESHIAGLLEENVRLNSELRETREDLRIRKIRLESLQASLPEWVLNPGDEIVGASGRGHPLVKRNDIILEALNLDRPAVAEIPESILPEARSKR